MLAVGNNFPNEIIIHIFRTCDDPRILGKMECICRNWKALIDAHPEIWKMHLSRLHPQINFNHVINPKLTLVSCLRNQYSYLQFSQLNSNWRIHLIIGNLTEVLPPDHITVQAMNYLFSKI